LYSSSGALATRRSPTRARLEEWTIAVAPAMVWRSPRDIALDVASMQRVTSQAAQRVAATGRAGDARHRDAE
jgi:hypothetical protein